MPRMARASVGGLCYHVINRGNAQTEVFHKGGGYQAELIGWLVNGFRCGFLRTASCQIRASPLASHKYFVLDSRQSTREYGCQIRTNKWTQTGRARLRAVALVLEVLGGSKGAT